MGPRVVSSANIASRTTANAFLVDFVSLGANGTLLVAPGSEVVLGRLVLSAIHASVHIVSTLSARRPAVEADSVHSSLALVAPADTLVVLQVTRRELVLVPLGRVQLRVSQVVAKRHNTRAWVFETHSRVQRTYLHRHEVLHGGRSASKGDVDVGLLVVV